MFDVEENKKPLYKKYKVSKFFKCQSEQRENFELNVIAEQFLEIDEFLIDFF